ncbi:MATE family multidrug resistance protein [Rhizomicrobium palustre]|uniref:Multidrug-efflux transporter n=1 Tax=Rhizomicrobium palustre TaxID=189966 RepID=A0A846N5R5_9PROT|nr:MATE family efflux transporter [Rhizomicrobium palustre]NIK90377.1 MATE family multidrug resistance protein [Rhizomicrobium palustre]
MTDMTQTETMEFKTSPWVTEVRELMKLALPLIATQLAQMAILTTDVIMLGRLSKEALAGAALGNTVFYFAWLFGLGPTAAISPMIAHILGAKPRDKAGVRAATRMGFWAIILLSVPLTAFLFFAKDVLILLQQKPELAEAASHFVQPLGFGMIFSLGFQVLRSYATALEKPNSALWVMLAAILFNAAADYALIFGHFGFPKLGLVGSGIASASSYAFSFFAMLVVVFLTPKLREYRIFRRFWRWDWPKFIEVFRLGMPIGMTMLFEAALFNSSMLIMGTFSTAALAAHQVALNVPSLTFMVPLGIAMAATVRVGLFAGAEDRHGVRRAGLTALTIGGGFMIFTALFLALFPRQIAGLYFAADDRANADVLALAITYLRIAAAFQVFDGVQVVASFALRGLKDARMPMWIAGASYWLIGFPLCLGLGVWAHWQGIGVWIGLAFALMTAAILLSWRFVALSRLTAAEPA